MFPAFMLAKLYVKGSLKNNADGFSFDIKNIIDATRLAGVGPIGVGEKSYEAAVITLLADGKETPGVDISRSNPFPVRLGIPLTIKVTGESLPAGANKISIAVLTTDVGKIKFDFTDNV